MPRKIDKHGLTPEQLNELWVNQHGHCAGCNRPLKEEAARLVYDPHTHAIRGFCCYRCTLLSKAVDDLDELEQIIRNLHGEVPASKMYAKLGQFP